MARIILFDIDGTLLLTGGAGKLAFDRVFSELYQIEGAWQNIVPDGRTDPCLIAELFERNLNRRAGSEEYKKVEEAYSRFMAETLHQAPRFRLMPGVEELLNRLHERKAGTLGLATGNFETTAYLKLERAGIREFFQFGGFGSDHRDRLILTRLAVQRGMQAWGGTVEPEEIFLVGDTIHDIRCGKVLGLTTVAVATGSTPKEVLASHRPDFLLDSLQPLEEIYNLFL